MGENMEALARRLAGWNKIVTDFAVLGKVRGTNPLKILAEGNDQEENCLLRLEVAGEIPWKMGDSLLMLPIENHQRYVILGKVCKI